MNRVFATLALLALIAVPALSRAADSPALKDLQDAVVQTIERAEPSIACILVSRSNEYGTYGFAPANDWSGKLGGFVAPKLNLRTFGRLSDEDQRKKKMIDDLDLSLPTTVPESFGSGVVIDASGLILTNAHVVRDATKVYVRLPGGRGSWADIHALDPRADLAVLRLIDKVPDLKPIKFGDGDKVKKGQFVISLANPFAAGFRDGDPSASSGMISNLRRREPGNPNEVERSKQTIHQFGTLLQTDAKLSLGCSGGALLNLQGELIGLTTATAALSGSETPGGYALPIDAGLKRVIEVLAKGEEVEYGFLGVQLKQTPSSGKGVQIDGVLHNMPADVAGLQANDTIVAIDGKPVKDNDDLFIFIGLALAGNTAQIEVDRSGQRLTLPVTLAKFYVPGNVLASKRPPARGGLRVDYTSILVQKPAGPFGQRFIPNGVVIREVIPNSSADTDGHLQKDKIITEVNHRPVKTPKQFYEAMADAAGKRVELKVTGFDAREDKVVIDSKN